MRVFLDCLPCLMKQVLDASRMATGDAALQEEIVREALAVLSRYDEFRNSPEIVRAVHRIVKRKTGLDDPYRVIKDDAIRSALSVYPFLKRFLSGKQNRLYWALKIAATGNIIDSAISRDIVVNEGIESELDREFSICDADQLEKKIRGAKTLLLIADNAGETVFDRVLMEELRELDITYATRSAPILNDATVEDAIASGIGDGVTIISSGCGAPGTILDECGEAFLRVYNSADIVISKGQANYETLSDADRDIFFLLKAKCPVISAVIGVNLGDYVLIHNTR